METILVVDDDPAVCEAIQTYLETAGYNALIAHDGVGMRNVMAGARVDLVILDLKLPGDDGFTLTRRLRSTSSVGIIILTGNEEEIDRIVGLELGADDYVAKPFSPRELLARIKTILRRTAGAPTENLVPLTDIRQFNGWRFDTIARRLLNPGGTEISLTTLEHNLLVAFSETPNKILDRDHLSGILQNRDWDPFDRSVDVLVGRLRAKIEIDPRHPKLIKTVRGVGYIFTVEAIEDLEQRNVA